MTPPQSFVEWFVPRTWDLDALVACGRNAINRPEVTWPDARADRHVFADGLLKILQGDLERTDAIKVIKAWAKKFQANGDFLSALATELDKQVGTGADIDSAAAALHSFHSSQRKESRPGTGPAIKSTSFSDAGECQPDMSAILAIDAPVELAGDPASVGVDDELLATLPSTRLEREDQRSPQSVPGILERLNEYSPISILVGPQLCGKTWLAQCVVEKLKSNIDGRPSVHHELVPPTVLKRRLEALNLVEFATARFEMYALWAQRMVSRALVDHFGPDEVRKMESDERLNVVFTYRDNHAVAKKDLEDKFKRRSDLLWADFLAIEWSVLEHLRLAGIRIPNLFLLLEIEDLHLHALSSSATREAAVRGLAQFWDKIERYAESGRRGIGESPVEGSLRILVTARQMRPNRIPARIRSPVTSISGFSETECLRYATLAGLVAFFPGNDLADLVSCAVKETAGYGWFVARFLRFACILRASGCTASPRDLASLVAGIPHFWYWSQPTSNDHWPDVLGAASAGELFPLPGDESRFLRSIRQMIDEYPNVVGWYAQVLSGSTRSYSLEDSETYLLPLLRCGLIQWRRDGTGFEAPNAIIRQHFCPDRLEALVMGRRELCAGKIEGGPAPRAGGSHV